MDTEAYKESLLRKQTEILSTGGIKPLQTSMETNTRQGDLADQASGNNEVHIQIKLKQTDAKILVAIQEALDRITKGTYGICRDCGEPIAELAMTKLSDQRCAIQACDLTGDGYEDLLLSTNYGTAAYLYRNPRVVQPDRSLPLGSGENVTLY